MYTGLHLQTFLRHNKSFVVQFYRIRRSYVALNTHPALDHLVWISALTRRIQSTISHNTSIKDGVLIYGRSNLLVLVGYPSVSYDAGGFFSQVDATSHAGPPLCFV